MGTIRVNKKSFTEKTDEIKGRYEEFERQKKHRDNIRNLFSGNPTDLGSDQYAIRCKIKFLEEELKEKSNINSDHKCALKYIYEEISTFFYSNYSDKSFFIERICSPFVRNYHSFFNFKYDIVDGLDESLNDNKLRILDCVKFNRNDVNYKNTFIEETLSQLRRITIKNGNEFGAIVHILYKNDSILTKKKPKFKEWIEIVSECLRYEFNGKPESIKPCKVKETITEMKINYKVLDEL